jgi:hypothetical protein
MPKLLVFFDTLSKDFDLLFAACRRSSWSRNPVRFKLREL